MAVVTLRNGSMLDGLYGTMMLVRIIICHLKDDARRSHNSLHIKRNQICCVINHTLGYRPLDYSVGII